MCEPNHIHIDMLQVFETSEHIDSNQVKGKQITQLHAMTATQKNRDIPRQPNSIWVNQQVHQTT